MNIKPPLHYPSISIIKDPLPFAPGMKKDIEIIIDTSTMNVGLFNCNIQIETKRRNYMVAIKGDIISKDENVNENDVFTRFQTSGDQNQF